MALTPKQQAILNTLREGGPIEDTNGHAVRVLLNRAGTHGSTHALSAALKDLEKAGLIEREINVRRTYRIALTGQGPVDVVPALPTDTHKTPARPLRRSTAPALSVVAPTTSDPGIAEAVDSGGLDYQRLAEAVFAIAVRNLRDREDLGDARQWREKAEQAQQKVETLRGDLAAAKQRADAAEAKGAVMEQNIERLLAQVERSEKKGKGYNIREAMDPESRAVLNQLSRMMAAPGSSKAD